MGQKNCSIKDEDELVQIIGKYRMTSELQWVDLKGGINDQIKKAVVKKDSYSSDSLDEYSEENSSFEIERNKISSDENSELDMIDEKSLSTSSSSVNDNTSITSHYSLEETETLQTEDITEAVDIRISPSNSIMSFDYSDNFYSEFSLVANVEVQIPDIKDPQEISIESQDIQTDLINLEKQREKNNNIFDFEKMDHKENHEIETVNNLADDDKSYDLQNALTKNQNGSLNLQHEALNIKMAATKLEKRTASSVEKKIAEEIKELKKREEDLRAMREAIAKEAAAKAAMKTPLIMESSVTSKIEKVMPPVSNCDEMPLPKICSVPKGENAYVKACVFAIKRKNNLITVDNSEVALKSSAITKQESPVEREIRIAKEREEELRRDREQAMKAKLELDTMNSELTMQETDADSVLSVCSDSSFDSVSKLAPLFSRTLSPDTSNSNGLSVYSSSAGSLGSLESLSQREKSNAGKLSIIGSSNGSNLSPSPDLTHCKPVYPFTSPTERRNKNVDMERFISSKGKEIKWKSNSASVGSATSYYEIRPPQVKKGEESACKRFVTAATKIQIELKEMQEREEQLKKDRENLQQELMNQENINKNGTGADDVNLSTDQIASSENIDHSDSTGAKDNSTKQDNHALQNRRRSMLIDEWEQRIQQSIQP